MSVSFGTPWTLAYQAPLSMGFPGQKYQSGLPFPSPGPLPNPGIEVMPSVSPALAGGFFTTVPPGKPTTNKIRHIFFLGFYSIGLGWNLYACVCVYVEKEIRKWFMILLPWLGLITHTVLTTHVEETRKFQGNPTPIFMRLLWKNTFLVYINNWSLNNVSYVDLQATKLLKLKPQACSRHVVLSVH